MGKKDSKSKSTKGKDKAAKVEVKLTKAERKAAELGAAILAAEATVADKSKGKKERKAARAFLDGNATPASVSVPASPDDVDLDDDAAVKAYNAAQVAAPGHTALITSNAEKAAQAAKLADPVVDEAKARLAAKRAEREANNAKVDEWVAEGKPKAKRPTKAEAAAKLDADAASVAVPAQVAEVVETEKGREFAVGAPALEPVVDDVERDRFGRPYIEFRKPDGKTGRKAYTRVTTYIDCLEDKTALTDWKLRTLLEGAGIDLDGYDTDEGRDLADSLVASARKVSVKYDKALAKVTKREAKGELELGQFALLRDAAKKEHKDALNALASQALELGGAHDKATKGTDLHALCERYDLGQLDLDAELAAGTILPADVADVKAYAAKMKELGIEHFLHEQLVVIDELGVAGTLDRGSMFKLPGTARRIRLVADIKTGNVEWGAGKIAMQLRTYALGQGYDRAQPLERADLKLSKSKGLLIHLPAGEARCEVYVVDLDLAGEGLRLAREVREWRNTGKRVFNLSEPLVATPTA